VPKVDFLLVDILLLLLLLNVKRKMSLTEMSVLIHSRAEINVSITALEFFTECVCITCASLLYQKERGVDLVF
jgi:hypothetical protein